MLSIDVYKLSHLVLIWKIYCYIYQSISLGRLVDSFVNREVEFDVALSHLKLILSVS